MSSAYWDDFEKRERETIDCIKNKTTVPVRRVAVFITNKCNFYCAYCNVKFSFKEMKQKTFQEITQKYQEAIIHITGGEPSTVSWLYKFIDDNEGRFHLNTNGLISPPKNVKRLKVSLDSHKADYFDSLVGHKNAFGIVKDNIKQACEQTSVSITCTLTKENYKDAPKFMSFCKKEFHNLYAVFFSIYKGTNPRFVLTTEEATNFFNEVKPDLEKEMDRESLELLRETLDEKERLLQSNRFPENNLSNPCYLSMSERVFDSEGNEYNCSHLFRDGILKNDFTKHEKCKYGCNRRLVKFNQDIERLLVY